MTTLTPTTINPTNNHFRHWVSLVIFSVVSLVSMTNFLEHKKDLEDGFDHEDWTRSQRAAVSVTTISLGLSVLGSIVHMIKRDNFSGTNLEFGLVRHLQCPLPMFVCSVIVCVSFRESDNIGWSLSLLGATNPCPMVWNSTYNYGSQP